MPKTPTKLLFAISSMGCGGAEAVLQLLVTHLLHHGAQKELIEIGVLTLEPSEGDFHRLPIGTHRIAIRKQGETPRPSSLSYNLQILWRIRQRIRTFSPNVIVSFGDTLNCRILLATQGLSIPIIVSERNDPRLQKIALPWRALRRALYPQAATVVVQTLSVKAWASDWLNRVQLIRNPVEPSNLSTETQPSRERSILTVGSLHRRKGHDMLITAFATIQHLIPDWRLDIAGDGPERLSLEQLITKLKLNGRAALLGRTPTPRTLYQTCGIFALSSRYEGFPNVLCEAMAESAPVVSFDCPSGPSEIITHETDGLLVAANDTNNLAAALLRLAKDPQLRRNLSRNASQAIAGLNPVNISREWWDAIEKVRVHRR